jgi:hypothetical protein
MVPKCTRERGRTTLMPVDLQDLYVPGGTILERRDAPWKRTI